VSKNKQKKKQSKANLAKQSKANQRRQWEDVQRRRSNGCERAINRAPQRQSSSRRFKLKTPFQSCLARAPRLAVSRMAGASTTTAAAAVGRSWFQKLLDAAVADIAGLADPTTTAAVESSLNWKLLFDAAVHGGASECNRRNANANATAPTAYDIILARITMRRRHDKLSKAKRANTAAFVEAALHGMEQTCRTFIEAKVDVNAARDTDGYRAIIGSRKSWIAPLTQPQQQQQQQQSYCWTHSSLFGVNLINEVTSFLMDDYDGNRCWCAQCGALLKTPQECRACRSVAYCNKQCQTTHWRAPDGHRAVCKLLKEVQPRCV
jgi:hypothetical protein